MIGRRCFLAGTLVLAAALVGKSAWAGTYLDRSTLLVAQATRDADFLRGRLADRELARVVHELAVARLKAASTMQVPAEVAQAHPHLLLLLENYERAADAAVEGEGGRFFAYVQRAREETEVFRAVLHQLGWALPKY